MKLVVDLERCQGHGKCYLLAPEFFAPDAEDDWGRPVVTQPIIDENDAAAVRLAQQAVANCPERAIRLEAEVPSVPS